MEYKLVDMKIAHQGAPVISEAVLYQESEHMVAILVDMKSKYCEVCGTSQSDEEGTGEWGPKVLHIEATEDACHLDDSQPRDSATEIFFPDYRDWDLWSASTERYALKICLIKSPAE